MLSLNYRDARPIYEQVKDGLRQLVVTGAMVAGEQFPSVRSLASSLAINPNTIQRAYEALEREGYLYTVVGRGSFVPQEQVDDNPRRERLLHQLDGIVTELAFLGVSPMMLSQRVTEKAEQTLRGLEKPEDIQEREERDR